MAPRKQVNPIVLKSGVNIGSVSAENDDDLLFSCFQDAGIYEQVKNFKNNKRFLIRGRTGSGKTAILRKLEDEYYSKVIRISPNDLCLNYISNSDVFNYMSSCGFDVAPFFEIIWKHTFATELIKRRYRISSQEGASKWYHSMLLQINQKKKRAVEYLKEFAVDLWPEFDRRLTAVTTKLEEALSSELEVSIPKFRAGVSGSGVISTEEIEVVRPVVTRFF